MSISAEKSQNSVVRYSFRIWSLQFSFCQLQCYFLTLQIQLWHYNTLYYPKVSVLGIQNQLNNILKPVTLNKYKFYHTFFYQCRILTHDYVLGEAITKYVIVPVNHSKKLVYRTLRPQSNSILIILI